MIKSFKTFESKIVEPESLSSDQFGDLVHNSQELPKHEFIKLKKYFAQFGSNTELKHDNEGSFDDDDSEPYYQSSVRGYYFTIHKLEGDEEWFGLRVYKPTKYTPVTDRWAYQNLHKPEYEGQIRQADWFYNSIPKPGYENMWIKKVLEIVEFFKCDQLDGVIDKIDEYLKLRTKKDPEIHFNKIKEKQYISDLKKKAMDKVRKMGKEDLENFINPKSK